MRILIFMILGLIVGHYFGSHDWNATFGFYDTTLPEVMKMRTDFLMPYYCHYGAGGVIIGILATIQAVLEQILVRIKQSSEPPVQKETSQ